MKIYCAGPWVHKADLKVVADELRTDGFEVVSRWHDTSLNSGIYEAEKHVMEEEAQKDYDDINKADTLVYLNLAKSEGKATELGIALAKGFNIYVVGGKLNNVFLHLPQIKHVNDLADVMGDLHARKN